MGVKIELYGGPQDGLVTEVECATRLDLPRQVRHWLSALDKARSYMGQPLLTERPFELYVRDAEDPVVNLAGHVRYEWVREPLP